jgi:hypothetical protein
MCATRRTRHNIREGGDILKVAMDDDNDYFSKESHIGADIIESYVTEGIPSLPPVESKGFQHLYKSTKTTLGREAPFLKYDNDDNFSKESRIGGDIIDSNVTEGLIEQHSTQCSCLWKE